MLEEEKVVDTNAIDLYRKYKRESKILLKQNKELLKKLELKQKEIDRLKKYEPIKGKINDIKTATLWKKKKSTFEPDFCAVKLDADPWIVQPFEIYEEIRIEEIKKKHQK